MSNKNSNLDLLQSSQQGKELTQNALNNAFSPASLFAKRDKTTALLTWGYYGGNAVINGVIHSFNPSTILLTDNATNYIELNHSNATVVVNTTGFATNNSKTALYSVVTSGGQITDWTDYRAFLKTNNQDIPVVSSTNDGLMTAADKVKLDSLGGSSGVTKIVAGSGISISPSTGLGEVTITATGGGGSGGGSGGPVIGSAVLRGNSFKNATPNADWSGYSVITKIDASKIINSCSSFKVKLFINSTTTSCKIEKFVIKRTNIGSTTVLDTTDIPINGQVASSSNIVTLSLTANSDNFITSDACNLSIDLDHDYYIIVYFKSDSVNVSLNLKQVSTDGDLNSEYASGDLTSSTSISQNTFGYALLFKQIIIAS